MKVKITREIRTYEHGYLEIPDLNSVEEDACIKRLKELSSDQLDRFFADKQPRDFKYEFEWDGNYFPERDTDIIRHYNNTTTINWIYKGRQCVFNK